MIRQYERNSILIYNWSIKDVNQDQNFFTYVWSRGQWGEERRECDRNVLIHPNMGLLMLAKADTDWHMAKKGGYLQDQP